jgi:S-adenosylmethionine:tRNA-ribosyltransferase-isomerase (queuine synthetase)
MNRDFLLESYHYLLPPKAIAQEPSHPAHAAKLLIAEETNDGYCYSHQTFFDF